MARSTEMRAVRRLYYLKETALAALQNSDVQLTVVTATAIEQYGAAAALAAQAYEQAYGTASYFSVPAHSVPILLSTNYSIASCGFFPREGQADLLLAVITDWLQYYVVVVDYASGRIAFSSPRLSAAPQCYFYHRGAIYYAVGGRIFAWRISGVPTLIYTAERDVTKFAFAEITSRAYLIVAAEGEVYSVDLRTGCRAFSFLLSGGSELKSERTVKELVVNDRLGQLFLSTKDDIFYIYDLKTMLLSQTQTLGIAFSYTGYFSLQHALPRDSGYLFANRDGELFDVDVVYGTPSCYLTGRMEMVLKHYGFSMRIKRKQRVFNQLINLLGTSKISADFFYACTANCAVCGCVAGLSECSDEHVSIGVSNTAYQMINRLRGNLMTQDSAYLNEFIENIESYSLGETKGLLDRRYSEIGEDCYNILKAYAFTSQSEFWETISSFWQGDPEQIQVAQQEEDEAYVGLDPYYKYRDFRVMHASSSEPEDKQMFLELLHKKFTTNPIEDAKQMGLSAYVTSYMPQAAPAIWKMSYNYYLAQDKMDKFNSQMANRSEFLKEKVLLLFSSLDELEEKTATAQELLRGYIYHYYDAYIDFLRSMEEDKDAYKDILTTAVPMHIHNKLAYQFYQKLIFASARDSAKKVVDFFKLNSVKDLVTYGKNPVTETIAEQLGFANQHKLMYYILQKFEIGKGEKELFAIMPNNLNQIQLITDVFTQPLYDRLKYVDQCVKALKPIETKSLEYDYQVSYHELYDMIEVNSCTKLMFMATTTLKNSVDATSHAIYQANAANAGSFQFLTLYDVQEYKDNPLFSKVIFHHNPAIFRLSDIINHVGYDLVWLNPRNKSWLDNQYIEQELKKYPIKMPEIKVIIANLLKAAKFIQEQELLCSAFSPTETRVIGWLDPTTVFLNLNTLEVHIPYLFEPHRAFVYQRAKLVDGVCYRPPELLFGSPYANSDVYSIAMLFVAMYYTFVYLPKQKAAKKKDTKPLSLHVFNIPHFVQLTEQLETENLQIYYQQRVKSPPNYQTFLSDVYSKFLISLIRAYASLCMDMTNLPLQQATSQIMSYLLRGDKNCLKPAQFYLNYAVFQPFANVYKQQESFAHSLYQTNKLKLQKFLELVEKQIQAVVKKCIVFNATTRLSLADLISQWKCEEVYRDVATEKAVAPQLEPQQANQQRISGLRFAEIKPSPSGEDLSSSSSEPEQESSEEYDIYALIDYIARENVEYAEEEVAEELPEEYVKQREQQQHKQQQIEAFKEMYQQQFGVIPDDMDLDKLIAENCVDFELPEDEKLIINLDSKLEKSEERNFFEEVVENPDKFKTEEPQEQQEERDSVPKSLITSVVNKMEASKSVYDVENIEQIEEYEVPEDFQQEGNENPDLNEERNWFELAAEADKAEQERLAEEKKLRKERKYAHLSSDEEEEEEENEEEGEEESTSESRYYEQENQAEYVEQHVGSASDKPIWALDSEEEEKAVVYNGEVDDSSSESQHNVDVQETKVDDQEHDIMIDDEGRAFWFDESGEMHYID